MNSRSIVLRLAGGLGNQLFQYAAFKQLCRIKSNYSKYIFTKHLKNYKTKREFMLKEIIDIDEIIDFELPFYYEFILKFRINKLVGFFKWYINKNNFDEKLKNNLLVVDDYFQNVNLIKNGMLMVLNKLQKISYENKRVNSLYSEINSKHENLICLHFRAGDYLLDENEFFIQTYDYYKQCIKELDLLNPTLVVFGDTYLLNEFQFNKLIISSEFKLNDWEEFLLMSKFNRIIISNSTYSFWSSIINFKNKLIFAPMKWSKNTLINDIWVNNLLKFNCIIK